MKTNDSNPVCPRCGASVPADAPQGLCPKCVLAGVATAPEMAQSATATGEIPSLSGVALAFPQLEIIELIGRGGMGFVFKARQPHLDRFVAVKLLPDKLARDPQFAQRFNREGRVLARLNHPNIVSVFDFGRTETFYFLLMEYVDGVNLRQAMQAGRFSPSEALVIVPKICEALQYAHEQGVLHRDIKPENILLDAKGRVKIADFGIAKLVGEDVASGTLTGTGSALGTPHYMAPEQLEQPSTVDQRADIYSLGVVFYEMLTGELPIGRFAPPSTKTPVDTAVDEVVFRTLEKDREKRYQTAGQVKTEVEQIATTPRPGDSPASAPPDQNPPERQALGSRPSPITAGPGEGGKVEGIGPGGTIRLASTPALADQAASAGESEHRISGRAVWGAVLSGLALLLIGGPLALGLAAGLGIGPLELLLVGLPGCLCGLGGTVLGWLALSEIRHSQGRLGGLPLAVFAALVCPLFGLVGVTLGVPALTLVPAGASGWSVTLGRALLLLVPAGVITFSFWAVYTTAQWAAGRPINQRRGTLKWVFLGIVACGIGLILSSPRDDSQATGIRPMVTSKGASARMPLPEGTVELVALSQHPSDGIWWRPDGTPSPEGPFENPGVSFKPGVNERAVEMVFRIQGLKPGDSTPQFEIQGHAGWSGGARVMLDGKPVPGSHIVAAVFPRSLTQTTVRVGVAVDSWQTLTDSGSNARSDVSLVREGRPIKVTFLGAHEKGSNTVLLAACDVQDMDVRVVAVTADGIEHPSRLSNQTREHLEAEFVDLPRDTIVNFRFQVRPYRWAEFTQVQLQSSPETTGQNGRSTRLGDSHQQQPQPGIPRTGLH